MNIILELTLKPEKPWINYKKGIAFGMGIGLVSLILTKPSLLRLAADYKGKAEEKAIQNYNGKCSTCIYQTTKSPELYCEVCSNYHYSKWQGVE